MKLSEVSDGQKFKNKDGIIFTKISLHSDLTVIGIGGYYEDKFLARFIYIGENPKGKITLYANDKDIDVELVEDNNIKAKKLSDLKIGDKFAHGSFNDITGKRVFTMIDGNNTSKYIYNYIYDNELYGTDDDLTVTLV